MTWPIVNISDNLTCSIRIALHNDASARAHLSVHSHSCSHFVDVYSQVVAYSLCQCVLATFGTYIYIYRAWMRPYFHIVHIHLIFIYGKQKKRAVHCNLQKYLHDLLMLIVSMCLCLHLYLKSFWVISWKFRNKHRILRLRCTSLLPTIRILFIMSILCFIIVLLSLCQRLDKNCCVDTFHTLRLKSNKLMQKKLLCKNNAMTWDEQ